MPTPNRIKSIVINTVVVRLFLYLIFRPTQNEKQKKKEDKIALMMACLTATTCLTNQKQKIYMYYLSFCLFYFHFCRFKEEKKFGE